MDRKVSWAIPPPVRPALIPLKAKKVLETTPGRPSQRKCLRLGAYHSCSPRADQGCHALSVYLRVWLNERKEYMCVCEGAGYSQKGFRSKRGHRGGFVQDSISLVQTGDEIYMGFCVWNQTLSFYCHDYFLVQC